METEMGDLAVRDLVQADVERVVEIALAAWAPIYAYYRQTMGDDLFALAFPDWEESKADQVGRACDPRSTATVCVAERRRQVIGFVTYYADPATLIGEIGNNAVHPDGQGMGIGTMMYQHVFDRLRSQGMRFVRVCTGGDPAHAPARRAYEKAGFHIQLPSVEYYCRL